MPTKTGKFETSLKNLSFIFAFIFLTGMVFTIFQYIPILEEETQTELSNKSCQDDTDADETNESGDDTIDALFNQIDFKLAHTFSDKSMFFLRHIDYSLFFKKIHTPPPKVS